MSEADVHRIICPLRDQELERLRRYQTEAEQVILALRRLLIGIDPSLPDEFYGTAWHEIEHKAKRPQTGAPRRAT